MKYCLKCIFILEKKYNINRHWKFKKNSWLLSDCWSSQKDKRLILLVYFNILLYIFFLDIIVF